MVREIQVQNLDKYKYFDVNLDLGIVLQIFSKQPHLEKLLT